MASHAHKYHPSSLLNSEIKKKKSTIKKQKMADQSNMGYKTGKATGQAQVKKDEIVDKAKQGTENAGGFLQQTGEQVKQMAQSATEAMKNAVGMGGSSGGTTTTTTSRTTNTTED